MNGRRSGAALIVGGMAAGGILSGAIASASVPDSDGVIHSCYSQAKGTWHPIDSPNQSCGKGETELAWNQTGPQGPEGPTGPTGPTGTFSGHFESPNGQYTLDVTDDGIALAGPNDRRVTLDDSEITLATSGAVVTVDGLNLTVFATKDVDVQSSGHAFFVGGITHLGGSAAHCAPAAAVGDPVNGGSVGADGGPVTGAQISSGSPTTFVC
jgi:hypothetical protein